MKNALRLVSLVCLGMMGIFYAQNINAQSNQLNRAFHHRAATDHKRNEDARVGIELGKVVFYFSQQPRMEKSVQAQGTRGELTVFFPNTELSAEAQKILSSFNGQKQPWYGVKLELVHAPVPGVRFLVHYDAAHVDVDSPEFFDSIGLQKGVIFRFYDKEMLKKIGKHYKGMLQTASLKQRPGIVIDCGHGGEDTGTKGLFNVQEKEITMQLGLQVAQLLRGKGFEVFLTRDADVSVALDARTSFANNCPNATIFVSIHANSAASSTACGVETFCLDPQLFHKDAHCLAHGYQDTIDQVTNTRCQDSCKLASLIHGNIAQSVSTHYPFFDRKVKHAVSQVLVGTNMPSALVEVGFLSNERETKLLKTRSYQQLLACGICNGIVVYANELLS
jgi:N-acetylmuramoyl-L-alanine amidase